MAQRVELQNSTACWIELACGNVPDAVELYTANGKD
jgi:hypothetical protein